MNPLTRALSIYRELAEQYDRLGQFAMRDCFLMLAADAARAGGDGTEAERLRNRLLQVSKHHMLRGYSSFDEAARVPDVENYLRDLRLTYPPEVAEQLLEGVRTPAGTPPTALFPGHGSSPVPVTAPLIDFGSSTSRSHDPYPVADSSPVHRPLAQPRPGRAPAPTREPIPVPHRAPEPIAAHSAGPAVAEGGSAGAWFSALLGGAALIAGLAWACYSLGQPFLPR